MVKDWRSGIIYKMPFKGEWIKWTEADLAAMPAEQSEALVNLYAEFEKNRLSFFLPHGPMVDGTDPDIPHMGAGTEGCAFLNDYENDVDLLVKSNQVGGTCHGAAWLLLRAIECDPDWHIFNYHGVKHPEWRGPNRRFLIASSTWDIMGDAVWPEYQKLLPRYELGQYAPDYGSDKYPEEKGRPRDLTFKDNKSKQIKLLKSKVTLVFGCYGQGQEAYESRQFDGAHIDEQMPEAKYDGYDERLRTRLFAQTCFTLTGHRIKGRTDVTGAGSWLHRKMFLGHDTKGHTVGRYKLNIPTTPHELYPKKSKEQAYLKWVVNPEKNNDRKALREGVARYGGGWQTASGTVIDSWDKEVSLIPDFKIPDCCTLFRAGDHGRQHPNAWLWLAVFPWGDFVIYREHYEVGKTVSQNVELILEKCGNSRLTVVDDPNPGLQIYEEAFTNERYFSSVLDKRSFGGKLQEREGTLGDYYNDLGLFCDPSREHKYAIMLPKVVDWFQHDADREHIMHKLFKYKYISKESYIRWRKRCGDIGGSICYVFDSLEWFQREIENWKNKEDSEDPEDKDDHLMSALKFLVAEDPRYYGASNED